jgi:hypothetical protein
MELAVSLMMMLMMPKWGLEQRVCCSKYFQGLVYLYVFKDSDIYTSSCPMYMPRKSAQTPLMRTGSIQRIFRLEKEKADYHPPP